MASDKAALQASILPLFLFDVLISDLKDVTECTLIKFAVDNKLAGPINILKGRVTTQSKPDRLEGWASLVNFKEESDCDPHHSCKAAEPQGWLLHSLTGERFLLCAIPHAFNEDQD